MCHGFFILSCECDSYITPLQASQQMTL